MKSHSEPWYLAYALTGAVTVGLVPILLPLWVIQTGTAAHVGLVMALLNIGQLSAPLWSSLAVRPGWCRPLFLGGFILIGASLAVFALTTSLGLWLLLALVQGVGTAVILTLANLLVVETHPKREWGTRIGSLQTFFGGGQVVGLALAGRFADNDLSVGLWLAAGLALAALPLAWRLPHLPGSRPEAQHPVYHHLPVIAHRTEPLLGSLTGHFYLSHLKVDLREGLQTFRWRNLASPFNRFLFVWFVLLTSSMMFFYFYPILMNRLYGLSESLAAWGYAGAAALGMVFYDLAGRWSSRYSAQTVLNVGLGVRLFSLAILALLGFLSFSGESVGVLLGVLGPFAVFVITWSLLSVSSTDLAVSFDVPQGEALGLYSAVNALSGMTGSLLGGWLAHALGYEALLIGAVCGLLVSVFLLFGSRASTRKEDVSSAKRSQR